MPAPAWLAPTFEWIWKTSWQASVLVALLLLVQAVLGRRLTAGWRYGLWLLVIARLIAPALPATRLSVFNWVRWERASAGAPIPAPNESGTVPAPGRNEAGSNATVAPAPSPAVIAPLTLVPVATPPPPRSWTSLVRVLPLGLIWLGGAGVVALFFAAQFWRFQRRLAGASRLNDGAALRALADACATVGLEWSPAVYLTPHVSSPALFGFGRPRLLLPVDFLAALRPEEIRHVFLHEAAHLKRGDMLLNWLLMVLQAAHWFNPVLWLAFARLRADRELACDELVLSRASAGDTRTYAQTIIKLLEGCHAPQALPGLVGILEDHNHMKRRITMITKFGSIRRWRVLAVGIVTAIGLVALTDAQAPRTGEGSASKAADSAAKETAALGTTLRRLGPVKSAGGTPRRVSPDGRYMVYNAAGNQLALVELASESVLKFGKGDGGAVFSSDSTRVAYVDGKQVRTIALDGSDVRTIYDAGNKPTYLYLYAWSPDGRWLAVSTEEKGQQYDGEDYQLGMINVDERSMRIVKRTGVHEVGRADFSPDGRSLVYELDMDADANNTDLFVLDLETGKDVSVVAHPASDRLLAWSAAANAILFTSNRRGTQDAWALRFAEGKVLGAPTLLKADLGRANTLGITRAGALYFSLRPATEDVFSVNVDPKSGHVQGAPTKTVERFEGFNSASDWSPDGRALAFSSQRTGFSYSLCILDAQTQRETVLGEGLFGPKWSPDGKSILIGPIYGSTEWNIYRVDVATSARTLLLQSKPDRYILRSYAWAPDGRAIYYQHESGPTASRIVRRDLTTGSEREIVQLDPGYRRYGGGGYFAISPDGQLIAFRTADNTTLYVQPVAGGPRKTVAKFSDHMIPAYDAFAWSADGKALFVCRWARNRKEASDDLVRVALEGGAVEPLLQMPRIRFPSVHPDGRRITFSSSVQKSELWMMEGFLPDARVSAR